MSRVGDARLAVRRPFLSAWDWWSGIPDEGQVSLVGLVLLGAGSALVWLPAGLIAPGVVMTAISLGVRAADRLVSVVLVAAVGLAVVAAIVVGGVS